MVCLGSQPEECWEPHWPLLGVLGMSPQLAWLHSVAGKSLLAFRDKTNTPLKCQLPLMGAGDIKTSHLKGASCFFTEIQNAGEAVPGARGAW